MQQQGLQEKSQNKRLILFQHLLKRLATLITQELRRVRFQEEIQKPVRNRREYIKTHRITQVCSLNIITLTLLVLNKNKQASFNLYNNNYATYVYRKKEILLSLLKFLLIVKEILNSLNLCTLLSVLCRYIIYIELKPVVRQEMSLYFMKTLTKNCNVKRICNNRLREFHNSVNTC